MTSMAGRVALVTGGTRGIGRATALALAARGADVAVNYRSNDAAAKQTVASLLEKGVRAIAVQADVADWPSVLTMVDRVRAELGPITILINNAGLVYRRPLTELSVEEWDELVGVNLRGVFLCTKAVIEDMLSAGQGAIVNVSSMAAISGGNVGPAYPAAKGGVLAFTRALGRELASRGVRTNAVIPTLTNTDQVKGLDWSSDKRDEILGQLPSGRLAEPEEVASVCAFLASDEASYVNGTSISVAGGQ